MEKAPITNEAINCWPLYSIARKCKLFAEKPLSFSHEGALTLLTYCERNGLTDCAVDLRTGFHVLATIQQARWLGRFAYRDGLCWSDMMEKCQKFSSRFSGDFRYLISKEVVQAYRLAEEFPVEPYTYKETLDYEDACLTLNKKRM